VTVRVLFVVGMRLIAIWFAVRFVGTLWFQVGSLLSTLDLVDGASSSLQHDAILRFSIINVAQPLIELVSASVLFLAAPRIAGLCYPSETSHEGSPPFSLSPEALAAVGTQMMGAYTLLLSIRPLARLVEALVKDPRFESRLSVALQPAVESALHFGLAAILFLGADRIARMIGKIKHISAVGTEKEQPSD